VIVAAGLLLVGLALFVAGILTGTTALYWACVAACLVAAVLIFRVWRQLDTPPPASADERSAPAGRPDAEPSAPSAPSAPAAGVTGESSATPAEPADPPVEEVEVTDLLLVVDLEDEVLVIDEHPRYHLAGCVHVAGRTTIPLPLDEARTDGFTPCAVCAPDSTLAERARRRK
jgi:hypothetical protein